MNWQLIEIYESAVFDSFLKCYRLQSIIEEEVFNSKENQPNYKYSKPLRLLTDLNNQAFLYPIILSSYSVFETSLQRLCKEIETDFIIKESNSPFHDYRLADLKKFLKGKDKRVKWKLSLWDDKIGSNWQLVKSFQSLRNCIAHYNGDFKAIPEDRIKYFENIKQLHGIQISPNNTIILSTTFTVNYIEFLNSFIKTVVTNYKVIKNCSV
jgi:hypothetical protein